MLGPYSLGETETVAEDSRFLVTVGALDRRARRTSGLREPSAGSRMAMWGSGVGRREVVRRDVVEELLELLDDLLLVDVLLLELDGVLLDDLIGRIDRCV